MSKKNRNKIFGNIKAWRNVIKPRDEVASGNYRQAEFAADLEQVARGAGSTEYTDAVEFFSRTYLTGGLKKLLSETLKRLTTGNGEPVIQLKTSFGGGKTHSLLALYHLFGGKIRPEESSAVREVLQAAGVEFLPKVNTAVVVGTWTNPLKSTIWGEIAARLAKSTGNAEIYELVRENDEKKISPGVDLLKQIFDAAAPCLILIDEIVAYGRKLKTNEVDGGTFDNLISFIQELTEAAKASKNTAVVVSIPESDIEVGGDLGKQVLLQVEKYFGRIELVWSPVTVAEGYEIVRRRLFKDCEDDTARQETCAAFFKMYNNNSNDFPNESRQTNYREKLLSCYPIHPQLFDYLYDKWSTIEGFQKTRGVLRLMSNVIHRLWAENSQSALIMPSDLPLDFSPVRDELTKYFRDNWDSIINSEIDGDKSKAAELDRNNGRFGNLLAARKIARVIFMGTAPIGKVSGVRGIEENEIRLGTIQPADVGSVSIFNDALSKLKENLYYLYSQNTRYWFGTSPTLRKYVDDKRETFSDDDINAEIEKRLEKWSGRQNFNAVHICPKNSGDVIDEQKARLVILLPNYPYDAKKEENPALKFAAEILDKRGNVPRNHKNTLLFMAAESKKLEILKNLVREYMAWREVLNETEEKNLDTLQIKDATGNLKLAEENFVMKLSQAYSQIFAPKSDTNLQNLDWQVEEINCTKGENISDAAQKFYQCEMIISTLGNIHLKNLLDEYIWRESESVELNKLWGYFTTFYYLPRLNNEKVLLEAVMKGVEAKTFAIADDENFNSLEFGERISLNNSAGKFLVKAEVAEKFFVTETAEPVESAPPVQTETEIQPATETSPPEVEVLPTRFIMDTELDAGRMDKIFTSCKKEIIDNFINLPDVKISVRLFVKIDVPEGISKTTKEIIESNCRDLKIDHFHFEN